MNKITKYFQIVHLTTILLFISCSDEKANDEPKKTNLFLTVKIDGITYEYYQYGFNGSVPSDPNNTNIANCGTTTDGGIGITGASVKNGSSLISAFSLDINSNVSSNSTITLNCINNNGNDDASFQLAEGQKYYSNSYVARTLVNQNCEEEDLCSNLSVTFIDFENKTNGNIRGYFSGKLYEPSPNNCESDIPHNIEGEFWLKRAD